MRFSYMFILVVSAGIMLATAINMATHSMGCEELIRSIFGFILGFIMCHSIFIHHRLDRITEALEK